MKTYCFFPQNFLFFILHHLFLSTVYPIPRCSFCVKCVCDFVIDSRAYQLPLIMGNRQSQSLKLRGNVFLKLFFKSVSILLRKLFSTKRKLELKILNEKLRENVLKTHNVLQFYSTSTIVQLSVVRQIRMSYREFFLWSLGSRQ